jgi:hypothetical protein
MDKFRRCRFLGGDCMLVSASRGKEEALDGSCEITGNLAIAEDNSNGPFLFPSLLLSVYVAVLKLLLGTGKCIEGILLCFADSVARICNCLVMMNEVSQLQTVHSFKWLT